MKVTVCSYKIGVNFYIFYENRPKIAKRRICMNGLNWKIIENYTEKLVMNLGGFFKKNLLVAK